MASGGTIESVLGKISREYLECPICCNRFKQPKHLDCLHSFCQICLQELRDNHDPNSTKLSCPLCRQETTLEEKNITDLPNNFTLSALVEEFEMQEQVVEGQESEITCQSCDENQPAIARCMDCNHFICKECQKAHERLAVMKSHKIYTLIQLQSGEVAYRSKLREEVPKCEKHSDQNLSVYCNTCEHMLCVLCVVLDHEYRKHSLVGLPEALDKCKHEVAELVEQAEKNKTALNIAIDETKEYHKKLDSMFVDTKKKISIKADKEVARIREEEKKLIEDLVKIYQDRVNTTDIAQSANSKEVIRAEQKLDEVSQLMAQSSCYEILGLRQKLQHNLSELTEKQPELLQDRLSSMDIEEGERSLGRLVLTDDPQMNPTRGKWAFLTQIETFEASGPHAPTRFCNAFDVAAFSNNEIVVVDNKDLIIFKMSSQTALPVISQGHQIKGFTNPRRVAVNKDDQLVVLDGREVMVLDRKYRLLHQFIPNEISSDRPSCLAVVHNNVIAVGYAGKDKISLHNPDGSLIKTLHAPMIYNFMTIYKHHIIYTNWSKQRLLSIDYNGSSEFSVDITDYINDNEYPYGVCCDSDGSIYVAADHQDDDDCSIHHFSPDGKYIGCAIEECGDPHGMIITPRGHLVLAAANSVEIYHRVKGKQSITDEKKTVRNNRVNIPDTNKWIQSNPWFQCVCVAHSTLSKSLLNQ